MLTDALRFDLIDGHGGSARIIDFRTALLEDDYPPITHILFSMAGKAQQIEWTQVSDMSIDQQKLRIKDFAAAKSLKEDRDILLKRDILDALILDLLGRRTTRVGDLLLEEDEGVLRVKAADSGFGAIVRRVTRGALGSADKTSLFDWKYVEFLRGDPQAVDNGAGYRLRINRLPAGEIARLADYIPYLHAAELLRLLPDEKAADVLEAMSIERQVQVIEELGEEEAVDLLCRMSPDRATDLVGRLHIGTMRRYVGLMPQKFRDRVVELLRYPENSVGGVMINDIISFPGQFSCERARGSIHDHLQHVDFTELIFLVDDHENQKLRGALSLRELLTAEGDRKLEDIMDPYLETLNPFDNAEDAAYKIISGQLPAMPVVEPNGRLIGAMTIEAAIGQLVPPTSMLQSLKVFS